jgi:hypothetical protein
VTRKIVEENRRAEEMNPRKSGIRTGNPQLEPHEGEQVRTPERQRAPASKQPKDKEARPGQD